MNNRIYRHSVWLDVLGVLIVGGVLLGGAAYLLFHVDGAATNLAVEAPQQRRAPPAARGLQQAPTRSRPGPSGLEAFSSESSPLLSDRAAPSGTATPFSEDWQKQAVPNLTGPSTGGGSPPGGGAPAGAGRDASSGPAIASARPPGHADRSLGSRSGQAEGRNGRSSWRGEARKLAGRAQALSSQLRQLEREASGGEATKKSSKTSPGEASTASASSNDRDVPNPPSVPIDDHLHWLVVAGLLWGIWRLS